MDDELPFFLYFATGACHSPHHAPAEWIERYKGHFAQGWDRWRDQTFARQLAQGIVPEGTVLTPRPPWVPSWDSLDTEQRMLGERFMECFAAFLSYTDQQIGRVLAFIEEVGDADDTVVIVVSDNGASSEGGQDGTINEGRLSNFEGAGVHEMYRRIDEIGGPLSHNNYPWGWTMAGNTPFKRWKREVHEGGVADPCIVRLPAGRGGSVGLRRQYAHAIDILPTVLELAGVAPPEEIDGIGQSHLDGTSFAYVLGDGAESAPGRHHVQHFEMLGSRAIYHDGWKAVTYHPVGPIYGDGLSNSAPFDDDVWELYHVAEDVSEARDRAEEFPEKVAELVALWWEEARRNDVLPLDNRVLDVMVHKHDRRRPQATYRYFQGGAPVPEWVAVDVRNRSHAMALDVDVPDRRGARRHPARPRLRARGLVAARPRRTPALRAQPARPAALRGQRRPRARRRSPRARVPLRVGRAARRHRHAPPGRRRRRGRQGRALHARRLQRGHDRADVRLRVGSFGGRRLRRALRVQRHHPAGRGVRHRAGGP